MIDSVQAEYCYHCLRAKAQGFTQLPYGRFLQLSAQFCAEL